MDGTLPSSGLTKSMGGGERDSVFANSSSNSSSNRQSTIQPNVALDEDTPLMKPLDNNPNSNISITTNNNNNNANNNPNSNYRLVKLIPFMPAYPFPVYFILVNELGERFCFYGLKAILFLYLTTFLNFEEDFAMTLYHTFVFFAYFFPLIGGVVADAWLGKYKTILYLSIVYCIGCGFLSFTAIPGFTWNGWGAGIGLLLIAIGTGGIKPCVSSFGGDQFSKDQTELLSSFFAFFYLCINFGSLISTAVTPNIREYANFDMQLGYAIAFGLPAVLLILATIIFVAGSRFYRKNAPTGSNPMWEVTKVIATGIKRRIQAGRTPGGAHWLDRAIPFHGETIVKDTKALFRIGAVFLPLPIFWALFDQNSSRWVAQAETMNRHIAGDFYLLSDQMQTLNPLFVLILLPLCDRLLYPFLRARRFPFKPLARMTVGMFLTSLSFVLSALVQLAIDNASEPNSVPILIQVPQYIIMTLSEVLVSVSGLEFAYREAPTSLKSVVTSLWLLTVAFGNAIVALVAQLFTFGQFWEYVFFASLMFLFVLIFRILVRNYVYVEDMPNANQKNSVEVDEKAN